MATDERKKRVIAELVEFQRARTEHVRRPDEGTMRMLDEKREELYLLLLRARKAGPRHSEIAAVLNHGEETATRHRSGELQGGVTTA